MSSPRVLAIVAALFGTLTVFVGARTLFIPAVRAASEPVVPFVLYFNTMAGLAYVASGVGLWRAARWAAPLSIAIAATSLLVLAALGVHIALGEPYAARTLAAMIFRASVWSAIAFFACRALDCRPALSTPEA